MGSRTTRRHVAVIAATADPALPPGWVERVSTSKGIPYFFNSSTGESVWQRPAMAETVRASHLLVKHAGSRRPSSWKEPVVTRSLGEARAAVSAFREQVERSAAGAPSGLAAAFASLAAAESHCSSARSGGDLGVFGRGQMQRVFEEAAFGLGVGEMSGLVESDSGRKKERESVFSFFLSLSSTFSRFET